MDTWQKVLTEQDIVTSTVNFYAGLDKHEVLK